MLVEGVAYIMLPVDGFCCEADIAAAGQRLQIKRGIIGRKADRKRAIQRQNMLEKMIYLRQRQGILDELTERDGFVSCQGTFAAGDAAEVVAIERVGLQLL